MRATGRAMDLAFVRLTLSLFLCLCCGSGAWRAWQAARADRLVASGAAEDLRKALLIEPGRADWELKLARADQQNPGALNRALALNPGLSAAWIEKGLRDEANGELDSAEASLVAAARCDQTVLPRWTLANYYVRRGREEQFWKWAVRTIDIAYSDPVPMYQLAWQYSGDAAEIASRLIPPESVPRAYLRFLLDRGHLDALPVIASRVARVAADSDRESLLEATDQLIENARLEEAVEIWNRMGERGLHGYPELDRARSPLTNGDFSHTPAGRGFDWRLTPDSNVSVSVLGPPAEVLVTFSGKQPESLDVLWQFVPLAAESQRWRFRFEYRTVGLAGGPQWAFDGVSLGDLPPAKYWRSAELPVFSRQTRHCLTLRSVRKSGSTRDEGELWLRNLKLERLTGAS
jgi:tetratricopeptide (TPR) repeat protein